MAITLSFTWTSTGNFPAGANPWNSQPLALSPVTFYYTPNQKPPAEEINYIYGQIAGDLANLAGGLNPLIFPARNWFQNETFPLAGPYALTFNESFYGASARSWIGASFAAGGTPYWNIYYESGTDQGGWTAGTHQAYGFGPTSISGIGVIPSTGQVWTCFGYSDVLYHFHNDSGDLATWAGPAYNTFTGIVPGTTTITVFNDLPLAGVYSTTPGGSALCVLTTSGVGPVFQFTASGPILIRTQGVNGTLALAIVQGAAGSSPSVYTTSNGTSWSTTALNPALGLAAGDYIYDVAWNASNNLWLMIINPAGGGFRCATSPDGVTWTAVGSTHTSGSLTCVGASGNAWVSWLDYGSTLFQMIYTYDGITWQFSNYELNSDSDGVFPFMGQSESQLAAYWFLGTTDANPPYGIRLRGR
jgi:hypothetical protein